MTQFQEAQQKADKIPMIYTRETKKRMASEVLSVLVAALKKGKK